MRLHPAVPALVSIWVVLGSVAPALATRSASNPSAKSLLQKLARVDKHYGSVKGTGSSTLKGSVKEKGKTVKTYWYGSFVAEASTTNAIKAQVIEPLKSTVNGKKSTATLDYVALGKQVSEHLKGRSGWSCQNLNALNLIPVWTPGTFGLGTVDLATTKATVLGSGEVNGAPVWRVRLRSQQKKGKASATNISILALDKHKGYLQSWSWSQVTSEPNQHLRLSSTVTFNHYGVHLAPALPGCKSKGGGSA